MSQTTIPTSDAKVVEGSDGLLLEIDGQIVPNYDATFAVSNSASPCARSDAHKVG